MAWSGTVLTVNVVKLGSGAWDSSQTSAEVGAWAVGPGNLTAATTGGNTVLNDPGRRTFLLVHNTSGADQIALRWSIVADKYGGGSGGSVPIENAGESPTTSLSVFNEAQSAKQAVSSQWIYRLPIPRYVNDEDGYAKFRIWNFTSASVDATNVNVAAFRLPWVDDVRGESV